MNCRAYHDLLQRRLDGLLIESPELTEHVRSCLDCRALEAATRRLQDGLRLLTLPLPPSGFAARITERVFLDRRRARRRTRRRWAVTLALTACLFVALALRLDWRGGQPGSHNSGPKPVEDVVQKEKTPAEMQTLRQSFTEAGEAVASLTSQTADETVGQTRWLVPKVSRPSLLPVDLTAIQPPTRPLRQAGAGVSTGLEPVTNSARRAVSLFLRELPPIGGERNGS
jgi:hypothetical protein